MNRWLGAVLTGLVLAVASAGPASAGPETRSLFLSGFSDPIPDNDGVGVVKDVALGEHGIITDLNVGVTVDHTWIGDLIVTLRHVPTGTQVTLIDRMGVPASMFGCSQDNLDVLLDDEAGAPIETQCASPVAGTFTPQEPLSAFDGETWSGMWRMRVSDLSGSDTGALKGFGFSADVDVDPPDALIRKKGEASYLGDEVFDSGGAGEERMVKTKKGKAKVFEIAVQNQIGVADAFVLFGAAGDAAFKVRYSLNGVDVTADITGPGGLAFFNVPAGRQTDALSLRVKPTGAASSGQVKELLVETDSGVTGLDDAVKAVVEVK